MPFFYAKDQGEEEKLSATHNIHKNGQNYGYEATYTDASQKSLNLKFFIVQDAFQRNVDFGGNSL